MCVSLKKKPAKLRESEEREREREREVFASAHTHKKKQLFFVPFVAWHALQKGKPRVHFSRPTTPLRGADVFKFKRLEGERERERGRTHPAIPEKF